jgi:hypothetical protein
VADALVADAANWRATVGEKTVHAIGPKAGRELLATSGD